MTFRALIRLIPVLALMPALPGIASPPPLAAKVTVQSRLLATGAGLAAAERDIRRAARKLCSRLRDTRLADDEELYRDCYRNAVRDALAALSQMAPPSEVARTSSGPSGTEIRR